MVGGRTLNGRAGLGLRGRPRRLPQDAPGDRAEQVGQPPEDVQKQVVDRQHAHHLVRAHDREPADPCATERLVRRLEVVVDADRDRSR